MGFRIDLTNNEMPGYEFPDPSEGEHSLKILHNLVNGNIEQITFNEVLKDMEAMENKQSGRLVDVGGYGMIDGTSMYTTEQEQKDLDVLQNHNFGFCFCFYFLTL